MITNICPIDRYEGPQWLITPRANEQSETPDQNTHDMIADIGDDYDILERGILGWGSHNVIIRHKGYWGTFDFLATISENES